ncbi:MAG: hypothetical protein H8D67_19260 [Deltaproteobacteria bacterium]|nr:hypothetical protein [Deltaproteobacteria bacterium]
MLRGVDLLALTVSDVTDHQGKVIEQLTIFQQTGRNNARLSAITTWSLI